MEADECSWHEDVDSDDPLCTPPTPEPTPSTTAGHPTPSPTDEEGCCSGHTPQTYTFCNTLASEQMCSAAGPCDWLVTDNPEDCHAPTPPPTSTTSTTPAPVYGEGCCTGYSAQTASFCNGFSTGDECSTAGVCSWIEDGDDSDCIITSPPVIETTPSPNGVEDGCCAGTSSYTWTFCGTLGERSCTAADECEWFGDDDDEDCVQPTPEPTPETTSAWPTPSPSEIGRAHV